MKERPLASIVRSLGRLSRRWLDRKYSFRRRSVRSLVANSGFSERMAEAMLDATFRELTTEKLWSLLKSELRDPGALDAFRGAGRSGLRLRARGPGNIVHVFSSNIPNAPILSFVLGMLLKSKNVGKLSSRDAGFLDLYLASLRTADPSLAALNRLLDPADKKALSAHLKQADLVVAYGNDDSLGKIRAQTPPRVPFVGYGHRMSAALYLKEALTRRGAARLAAKAARDVWMADQRGCLSPLTLYIQKGGAVKPAAFAGLLARELGRLQKKEKTPPKRDGSQVLETWIRRLKASEQVFWQSAPAGLWAVSYGEDLKPAFAGSSQQVSVRGFGNIGKVHSALQPIRKYLQAVALECALQHRQKIAEQLSLLGVNRICRAGHMQHPPVTWHHDGKPNLANWIHWTDLEE